MTDLCGIGRSSSLLPCGFGGADTAWPGQ